MNERNGSCLGRVDAGPRRPGFHGRAPMHRLEVSQMAD
jgi:hypothetical protein